MWPWLRDLVGELGALFHRLWMTLRGRVEPDAPRDHRVRAWGLAAAIFFVFVAILVVAHTTFEFELPSLPPPERRPPPPDLTQAVRPEPKRFPPRTRMPHRRESSASGAIGHSHFTPEVDLIRVHDRRVWWESEHDRSDTEDDHLVHYAMEEPLRRLIELVARRGGRLRVQDTYRKEGIHSRRSLHKEGRAVDLTADGMSLESLAKLCWAAGFDWVYYEAPKRGGAHVHASVRADRPWLAAEAERKEQDR